MPIESLSSFAISVAANIVSSLFARNSTEKDIREAFQEAIEKWCPNEDIRRFREADIASFVRGYIQNPSFDEEDLSGEMKDFLRCFEESVASHPVAFAFRSSGSNQYRFGNFGSGLCQCVFVWNIGGF